MRFGKPALWVGSVSALLVVAFVWSDRGKISPGPVSAAHARDAELAGQGCERCHASSGADMATACAECHREVVEQLASARGFHGTLSTDASACGTCHVEHHGDELPLVAARTFALAGFEDRDAYDHRGLDFGLAGRHAALACKECHEHADREPLPEGGKRFLGLTQSCTACHDDVHDGKLPDCASCHGQEHPFEQVASFVHSAAFRLENAHAGRGCRECHPKEGPHSIEDVDPRRRACVDCHASPHAGRFLVAVAASIGVAPGAACESCHPAVHEGFDATGSKLSKAQHAATGFPLDAPHDRQGCEACHPRDAASFAASHPGRSPEDCQACHADPHAGQFDRGVFAGAGCLGCHDRHAFAPAAFDIEAHARTGFALTGSHAAVPCASCHASTIPVPGKPLMLARRFEGASAECGSCHADAHEGFFDRPGRLAQAERAKGCAECHGPETFSETIAEFAHARRTGFALEGAHERADCAACHPTSGHPDETGRSFGRAAAPGPGESCRSCHADPHAGAFDRRGRPREVEGRDDCARCHTVEAFHPTRAPFDHATWTGFPLVGAHSDLSCERCHAPSATPGRFTPARGTACASCHADPHVGQFASGGRTDCARCHADSGSFREVDFDHQRDSRFHLDEGHRNLACSACHVPFPAGNGVTAVRYKPLGTACGDCHQAKGARPR